MPSACTAFIDLSVGQTIAILVMTLAAIALTWALGLEEGRYRGRREERELARQHGSQGLRLIRGEDDGE